MSNIAVILVHMGENHPESKRILDIVNSSGLKGISKILANSPETQEWLCNNEKGIVIRNYPSFLVAQEGKNTQIYSSNDVNIILEMLKSINSP